MIGLIQYFREKYNVKLRFSQFPLILEKTPKGANYYPMELLYICENQRVTLTQQSSNQVQQMIKVGVLFSRLLLSSVTCARFRLVRYIQVWDVDRL